ncbi:MAG: Fic family protein [Bifidobacteriaceae bacterium]|jgi:Fic family protein|nr:Fic family protein [Bifidobacteriaceae bacterium]
MQTELDRIGELRNQLNERFPDGIEAGIAQYREWLRSELTYTSNALEGSTLSSIETRMVIEDDAILPNKSLREHLEARDHAIAWDYATDVLEKQPEITAADILSLHGRVLYSTNNAEAGFLRRTSVRLAGSQTVFPNPLRVPDRFDALVEEINHPANGLHPVVHAAHIHLDFVKIHPFVDGNGRTARILMNVLLRRAGFPAVPIYPQDRREYLNAIGQADGDEGVAFAALIARFQHETIEQLLNDDTTNS